MHLAGGNQIKHRAICEFWKKLACKGYFNVRAITGNQFIVAADVTNRANDQNQLEPMEQLRQKTNFQN